MDKKKCELLAPAGNKEAFLGAIHAGADAVYLAGSKYGARAYADNFSNEDLLFCIRYAHIFGKKVYLTVNTLFKEEELSELCEYIKPFYESGLDACIVQDLGVFQLLKTIYPDMELHVSTQMTITGAYGAEYLKKLGASRIVPAREMSLEEIQKIKETGVEVETFIHGAMCYSYSGQCLFSSILGGRSGNRGRCAQPCRLPYKVKGGDGKQLECYPLSLKDMCTLEHLDTLMESGIDSFKIEGRMKKAEYAAGVTAIYRKYMDQKLENPHNKLKVEKADLDRLAGLYIRSERQDGYYFRQNDKDMVTLDNPAYSGSDEAYIAQIRAQYIENKPRIPITMYAVLTCGEKASLTIYCDDVNVTVYGDVVEKANQQPLSEESIRKQLGKLGDTCFERKDLEIYTDGQAFYSLKSLNELRREAILQLENQWIEKNGFAVKRTASNIDNVKVYSEELEKKSSVVQSNEKGWSINISTKNQWDAFREYYDNTSLNIRRIYLESELVKEEGISGKAYQGKMYIALPYCFRQKDYEEFIKIVAYAKNQDYNGFLARNIETIAFLKKMRYDGEVIADASVYVWNSGSLEFWSQRMNGITYPYELNFREGFELLKNRNCEKVLYGRLPMMITANCIQKTINGCNPVKKQRILPLQDRYQKVFPVYTNCTFCHNIIYNSVPLSLHKDMRRYEESFTCRLMFTVEDKKQTLEVFKFFEALYKGEKPQVPYQDYTTGHEKRGVE